MARLFLCLAAAACCCLALLLAPPVHGRRAGIGLAGGSGGGRDLPLSGPHVNAAAAQFSPRDLSTAKAKLAWSSSWTTASSSSAAGRVRPELRSVPGGPDPLHHHGSPWRPELEPTTP